MAKNVRIKQDSTSQHVETGYFGVTNSAQRITATSRKLVRGVWLKNPAAAVNTVFVGCDKNLTAGTATSRSGYPIEPGEAILFPVDDIANLWLIASVAGPTNVSYYYS